MCGHNCIECENWTGPRNCYFGSPAGLCSKGHQPGKLYELNSKKLMNGEDKELKNIKCDDYKRSKECISYDAGSSRDMPGFESLSPVDKRSFNPRGGGR